MKNIIVIFLFALFANDVVVIDVLGADCTTSAAACHGCVCGPHVAAPRSISGLQRPSTLISGSFPAASLPPESIFDKSFFHPPVSNLTY